MSDYPKRGGIYWINLDDPRGKGRVQAGRRPALVLSNDANNMKAGTVTVAPVTSHKGQPRRRYQCFVPRGVAGLSKDSLVKLEQVVTIDQNLVGDFIGTLPNQYLSAAVDALKIHLDIWP